MSFASWLSYMIIINYWWLTRFIWWNIIYSLAVNVFSVSIKFLQSLNLCSHIAMICAVLCRTSNKNIFLWNMGKRLQTHLVRYANTGVTTNYCIYLLYLTVNTLLVPSPHYNKFIPTDFFISAGISFFLSVKFVLLAKIVTYSRSHSHSPITTTDFCTNSAVCVVLGFSFTEAFAWHFLEKNFSVKPSPQLDNKLGTRDRLFSDSYPFICTPFLRIFTSFLCFFSDCLVQFFTRTLSISVGPFVQTGLNNKIQTVAVGLRENKVVHCKLR